MSAQLEIIDNSTTVQDASVTQAGFGTPLIACAHSYWPELVRTFGSLSELVTAGVANTHHLYKKAAAFLAQNPSVGTFKVGKRRTTAYTHTITLTVPNGTDGDALSVVINGQTVSTVQAGGDAAGSLDAAITAAAISGVGNAEVGGVITLTASAADTLMQVSDLSSGTVADTTADSGISTDLAAIRAYDGDWYGLVIDGHSDAQINAAAAWAETETILAGFTSQDSDILNAGVSSDIASDLSVAGLHRSFVVYHPKPVEQCAAARLMGLMLPKAPGSASWANKHPAGLDRIKHTAGEVAGAKAKKAIVYADIGSLGFTLWGWAASGRYMDITRGIDWFDARLAERMLFLQANVDKIPFTDQGGALIESQIRAQVLAGQGVGLIAEDPEPTFTTPLVASVNPNDKAQRRWPGFGYSFVLQGAAQSVIINGTATV